MNRVEFTDLHNRLCQVDPKAVVAIIQFKDDEELGPCCGLFLRGGQRIEVQGTYDEVVAALKPSPVAVKAHPKHPPMLCPNQDCVNDKPIRSWGGWGGIDHYRCGACGKSFTNP